MSELDSIINSIVECLCIGREGIRGIIDKADTTVLIFKLIPNSATHKDMKKIFNRLKDTEVVK